MRRVVCEECGKVYNYEADEFCPKCGAFNQPDRQSQGTVRVDGINENNHQGSFSHREAHQEKRTRRSAGLDRDPAPAPRPAPPPMPPRQSQHPQQSQKRNNAWAGMITALIFWIIFMAAVLSFCGALD